LRKQFASKESSVNFIKTGWNSFFLYFPLPYQRPTTTIC
jgi:hypothetical protein